MKMQDTLEITGAVTLIIGFIIMLVFLPVLTFGLAYFGGWILKLCVGDSITYGLNLVFNTSRFTPDIIPVTCATLATIGKYFKSMSTSTNKSK